MVIYWDWTVLTPHISLKSFNPGNDLYLFFKMWKLLSFSPSATFLFYSLPVVDWLPRPPVSLDYYHPSFPLLVWFLSPQAGICVMSVDSPQSPEESIDAKHSSICQSKRTQSVLKKTSGHEAQWDINNPCFQKIKIRKSLHWNIKWHWVEYSMLVTFDSFNDFFAILCSVIRKVLQRRKNCPMMIAISVGFARHALEKTVWNPCATPPLTCGRNHPH